MVKTRNARRCVMMYCSLGKTATQEPTVIDPLTRLKMTLPWPTRTLVPNCSRKASEDHHSLIWLAPGSRQAIWSAAKPVCWAVPAFSVQPNLFSL